MPTAHVRQRVGTAAQPNQENADAGVNAAHHRLAAAHKRQPNGRQYIKDKQARQREKISVSCFAGLAIARDKSRQVQEQHQGRKKASDHGVQVNKNQK